MSPDTVSSLFPDRPIRPLPRRRLRERLSPEVADSIKYPPSNVNTTPLFHYPPYTIKDHASTLSNRSINAADRSQSLQPPRNYTPRRNGAAATVAEVSEAESRCAFTTRGVPGPYDRHHGRTSKPQQRQGNPQAPASSASSVDGYDSFENTNNKKKRKIPSAGDSLLAGVHGAATDMNTASGAVGDLGERSYPGSAGFPGPSSYGSSAGISGPGRGRLGRSSNGRSPLRALSDGNNAWGGRGSRIPTPHWASPDSNEGGGIISNAIANAEKHVQSQEQGRGNVSLLQQHLGSSKVASSPTQFTFTCDSQVPGSLQWPGNTARGSMAPPPPGAAASRMAGPHEVAERGPGRPDSRRRNRRRLEKELKIAARHRKQATLENNHHNPPKREDMWICEFCEYESIFGEPPRALVRDYELKARRARQEEADRKRLLEKAKAKGRKAKKNGKAGNKAGANSNQPVDQINDDGNEPSNQQDNGQSTQSEEDYEEDYVAEYDGGYAGPNGRTDDRGGTRSRPGPKPPIPRPASS